MKRGKKKQARRAGTMGTPVLSTETAANLVLSAKMPGALMYRRPYPPGVPDMHTMRSSHLHVTAGGAVFSSIPKIEKRALFDSLTKTLRRSEYHRRRYADLRGALNGRRENLPGEVFWDEFVETLHFELQAFCGAARMMLDELIYLVARCHGVPPKKARKTPWETADLIKKPLPNECQVPEIALARTKLDWFELLNAYRNSFFHHGWRHGSGHFSETDQRGAARNPAANALLVPDQRSLGGRSKPHERTYNDGTTADDVMRLASTGLDEILRELCEGPWGTSEPAPGKIPRAEQANMIVTLANPALYLVHDHVVIPFFTKEELGRAFGGPGEENVELVDMPVVTSVTGHRAVSFALKGLEQLSLPPGIKQIKLLIDPVVKDATWREIACSAAIDVEIERVLAAPMDPMGVALILITPPRGSSRAAAAA